MTVGFETTEVESGPGFRVRNPQDVREPIGSPGSEVVRCDSWSGLKTGSKRVKPLQWKGWSMGSVSGDRFVGGSECS